MKKKKRERKKKMRSRNSSKPGATKKALRYYFNCVDLHYYIIKLGQLFGTNKLYL